MNEQIKMEGGNNEGKKGLYDEYKGMMEGRTRNQFIEEIIPKNPTPEDVAVAEAIADHFYGKK